MAMLMGLSMTSAMFLIEAAFTGDERICTAAMYGVGVLWAIALISFVLWFLFLRKTHRRRGPRPDTYWTF